MITFRAYEPEQDEFQVYQLWQRMLGEDGWPIPRETFHAVTVDNEAYQPGDHFVMQDDSGIVGFVATQIPQQQNNPSLQGKILVILMAPKYLGEGFGRALLNHAIIMLKRREIGEVQLGGGSIYFWQGVPTNLGAWLFFEHLGWPERERSFDLIRDLHNYTTPPEVYERLRPSITVGLATPGDREAILQFEKEHFPEWLLFYGRILLHNSYTDIVVAKDAREGIVGISSILDPRAIWWHYDMRWLHLLAGNTGGVGPLGVAETMRAQGIGLALAARVTEELRNRGFVKSYVGWTWLLDWYGKLGYKVWQEYIMSWRKV